MTRDRDYPEHAPKYVDYSDLRDLWDAGLPTREIARRKGVSAPAVSKKARRIGLDPRPTFHMPGVAT